MKKKPTNQGKQETEKQEDTQQNHEETYQDEVFEPDRAEGQSSSETKAGEGKKDDNQVPENTAGSGDFPSFRKKKGKKKAGKLKQDAQLKDLVDMKNGTNQDNENNEKDKITGSSPEGSESSNNLRKDENNKLAGGMRNNYGSEMVTNDDVSNNSDILDHQTADPQRMTSNGGMHNAESGQQKDGETWEIPLDSSGGKDKRLRPPKTFDKKPLKTNNSSNAQLQQSYSPRDGNVAYRAEMNSRKSIASDQESIRSSQSSLRKKSTEPFLNGTGKDTGPDMGGNSFLGKFSGKSTLPRSNTLSSGLTPSEGPDNDEDCVNVVVRVRPMSQQEIQRGEKNTIQFPGDGAVWVDNGTITKSFTFNVMFEPEASQEDVFEHCGIKKLVEMALNGYSCTAFAFGQTGSGKTHTITGPPELFGDVGQRNPDLYGLLPRSFHYLFHMMRQKPSTGYRLSASFLEIYNEQVVDLLNPNQRKTLSVRWSKNKGFYVENLFLLECESIDDLMAVLEEDET